MAKLSGTVCIFDLDGTLVNSAPDLTAALNRALLREGLKEIDESKVRGLVGEGARALLTRGFAMQDRVFPDGEEADRLVLDYIDDYASRISEHSHAFPGVEDALDRLSDLGATLAICTNKVERLTEPLLKDLGLWDRFAEIVSADSLPEKKPSALPLLTIKERTGAERGVMLGDTATDFLAAEAAGMPCLIFKEGYGAGDPRIAGAPVFDDYEALPELVLALPQGA
ncbi:HAD-IA family hydrolase [Parvularcula sp. ZS-1/3]|uniref:Phosphoglycolate phosphatase n=1 Tax=Parvularcula mediterranea TaxID=2732508 RepID=A0A7Y3RLF4_9PROT|nr:HAD-IA family hydrolase [Parvularcula mediterranea]NNU16248.1 HAD-IA family hydrolase [Parvularcula mediterranea]